MFHIPAHKSGSAGQVPITGPRGSIAGASEFDSSDSPIDIPRIPTTLAELMAVAVAYDNSLGGRDASTEDYTFLLGLIMAAGHQRQPLARTATVVEERACATCQYWHTPPNGDPCKTCLPKAVALPYWTPRVQGAAECWGSGY